MKAARTNLIHHQDGPGLSLMHTVHAVYLFTTSPHPLKFAPSGYRSLWNHVFSTNSDAPTTGMLPRTYRKVRDPKDLGIKSVKQRS
jgi:hypothetical protein